MIRKPEFWLIFKPEMAQKFWSHVSIFNTPTKVAPMSLLIRFQVNPAEIFQENIRKPISWGPKGPENLAYREQFSHTLEGTHNMPVNHVKWSLFFWRSVKKLEAKGQKYTFTAFWAILLCKFTPNIGKFGWKLRESIWFEKKVHGRTTDGSPSDKFRWQQRSKKGGS